MLRLRSGELLTSGSVNVNQVKVEFSSDWAGMERVAVFRCGSASVSVLLDGQGQCPVPHEALEEPGRTLYVGVYGRSGAVTVLPTVWASLGQVQEGAMLGGEARPPTPDLWRQELDQKQDRLTGLPGQVVGFDGEGNAVPQDPTGGGGPGYVFGHGLRVSGKVVSVHALDGFEGDNTLPITAAAVERTVGNIAILLRTI